MLDGVWTVSFNRANLPFRIAGGGEGKRAVPRARVPAPFAPCMRPSSVVLQPESGGKHKDPILGSSAMGTGLAGSILGQANTVGVIGGVSATSTVCFLDKLVKLAARDGGESPPFIVCSDPELSREAGTLRERNSMYMRSKKAYGGLDHGRIVDRLRKERVFLEQAGARCLVMPCHVSYAWFEEVARGCSVPFLHVGECVADELKEARLKPMETGSNIRIGVVAPDPMLIAGIYQQKIQNQGFEVVFPDEATMEHTVTPAMDALSRKDIEGARNLLRVALQVLLVRAVNTIILASEELRGLLLPDDPLLKKCIDPMDALARCTVHFTQSRSL